jgi:hypothetical protein
LSRIVLRISIVFLLAALGFFRWPIAPVQAGNGDISSDTDQDGSSDSGDAVGGQVVGVASSGRTSVDATNRSEDVDVSSGDASGSNTHDGTVTGSVSDPLQLVIDVINLAGGDIPEDSTREVVLEFLRETTGADTNEELIDLLQEEPFEAPPEALAVVESLIEGDEFVGGDVESSATQSGDVGSGDVVAGQAIGVVTQRRGQADVVVSNVSEEVSLESGDTDFTNSSTSDVGQFVAAPK